MSMPCHQLRLSLLQSKCAPLSPSRWIDLPTIPPTIFLNGPFMKNPNHASKTRTSESGLDDMRGPNRALRTSSWHTRFRAKGLMFYKEISELFLDWIWASSRLSQGSFLLALMKPNGFVEKELYLIGKRKSLALRITTIKSITTATSTKTTTKQQQQQQQNNNNNDNNNNNNNNNNSRLWNKIKIKFKRFLSYLSCLYFKFESCNCCIQWMDFMFLCFKLKKCWIPWS